MLVGSKVDSAVPKMPPSIEDPFMVARASWLEECCDVMCCSIVLSARAIQRVSDTGRAQEVVGAGFAYGRWHLFEIQEVFLFELIPFMHGPGVGSENRMPV